MLRRLPLVRKRKRAEEALKESTARLDDVRERGEEARQVAAALRRLRRENHFGPAFQRALEGGR